jgi:hypothetical protein
MDLSLLPGGRRLDWEHLSAPVREALQARLGSPVMHAATQPGGFSPGWRRGCGWRWATGVHQGRWPPPQP